MIETDFSEITIILIGPKMLRAYWSNEFTILIVDWLGRNSFKIYFVLIGSIQLQ